MKMLKQNLLMQLDFFTFWQRYNRFYKGKEPQVFDLYPMTRGTELMCVTEVINSDVTKKQCQE